MSLDLSAPPTGNTVDREGVVWRLKTWGSGEIIRNFTFDKVVPEAEAQWRVCEFFGGAAAVLEYASGGDGTGCDALRINSWINIDRRPRRRLSLPSHINLGAGTSFTMGGSKALSLFGRNPIFWMGQASISLISPILFEVRVWVGAARRTSGACAKWSVYEVERAKR
jgi:hypothetical protein